MEILRALEELAFHCADASEKDEEVDLDEVEAEEQGDEENAEDEECEAE